MKKIIKTFSLTVKECFIVVLVAIIIGLIVYCNHMREEYQKKEDTLIMMYNSKCNHAKVNYKLLRSY